jgi:hypothetical protein
MTSGLLTISVADATNFSLSIGDDCPVYTDATATKGLVMSADPNVGCHVAVFFKPQTVGTGTFETDLTMRATPGSLKTIHITGVAQSAMHTNPATSAVRGTSCTIENPCLVTAYLDAGAPLTSYVKTSITGGNYMIVEDQCVATKMLGGDSCRIYVAYLGTTAEPLKTGTLTVNGGNAGNTATLVLNSTNPPAQ